MLMSPMRDGRDGTTSEDRATQLLICEPLSFATASRLELGSFQNLVAPVLKRGEVLNIVVSMSGSRYMSFYCF